MDLSFGRGRYLIHPRSLIILSGYSSALGDEDSDDTVHVDNTLVILK